MTHTPTLSNTPASIPLLNSVAAPVPVPLVLRNVTALLP